MSSSATAEEQGGSGAVWYRRAASPDGGELAVSLALSDGRALVTAVGGMEWRCTWPLEQALDHECLAATSETWLDLSGLEFADSSLLHLMLDSQRVHRARDARLVLAGALQPVVERLFTVTGTTAFFTRTPL
ncbi:STAS domain-containing protein [Streptomyces parvus]|uniref:STAS domain-containing protein n=1 Tax=Streptomyces TaxID=1883 RepID=UPI00067DDC9B|nr:MULTISPECIES: STAS domain-containing protein [unclassified Streptomyces]MYX04627.1 STAS domain-containing protein [Streptomyces sp. SID8378]PVD02345.1 anti-sigma factor antagonist [Streptomyces sp. CS147]SNB88785.1 anti-anti-sigma factor [Streptomyces sp. PgraA7]